MTPIERAWREVAEDMLAERDAARTERDALRQALVTWYGSWTDDSQCDVLAKHIPDNNWGLTP